MLERFSDLVFVFAFFPFHASLLMCLNSIVLHRYRMAEEMRDDVMEQIQVDKHSGYFKTQ